MTLCHNCHRPAVAVVVLSDGYQLGRCCWSTPHQADEQPAEPQQTRQRKQRQGQH